MQTGEQWPSNWPSVPPGYKPLVPTPRDYWRFHISHAFQDHPWVYWITALVLALVPGDFFIFIFVLVLAGALFIGTAIHDFRRWDAEERRSDHERKYGVWHLTQAWSHWWDTRAMRQLPKADYPSITARQHLISRGGSAVIGIDTTIHQDFVVVGPRQSMVVIGPSGSAKTLGIAIPAVSLHPGPAMFSSTKTDGLRHTALARSAIGRLWLFDPTRAITDDEVSRIEKETGTRIYRAYWSPLFGIHCWNDAKLVAKDMVTAAKYGENSNVNSQHWNVTSEEYLAPMLLAAALHPDCSMNVVRRWIRRRDIEECETILLAASFYSDYRLDVELALDSLISRKGDRNVKHSSDVWSTLNTLVQAYEFTQVASDAARHNFDPNQFVRSSDTLYIAGQAKLQEAAAPLYVALIDSLYDACVALDRSKPFEQGTRPSLLVALDEAANSAPSPRLIRYLSEGAGQGFQLMVFLQSGAQAETIWRRHGRSLLDFAAVKVIFGGISDRDTLEAFSVLSGDYDRVYVSSTNSQSYAENWSAQEGKSWSMQGSSFSKSTSAGGSWTFGSSETVSRHKERQMTPGDIARLGPGEALVVTNERWEIIRAGGSLISAWLNILHSPSTPIQRAKEPEEIERVTLDLAHIDELVAWRRANEASKPGGLRESDDDDDDDDDDGDYTYAVEVPR